jgi:hypothetical protein
VLKGVISTTSYLAAAPRDDRIDLAANAFRADERLALVRHCRIGPVPRGHVGWVGLDLMLTFRALDNEPHAGRSGIAEGHRGPGSKLTQCAAVAGAASRAAVPASICCLLKGDRRCDLVPRPAGNSSVSLTGFAPGDVLGREAF